MGLKCYQTNTNQILASIKAIKKLFRNPFQVNKVAFLLLGDNKTSVETKFHGRRVNSNDVIKVQKYVASDFRSIFISTLLA